MKTLKLISLGLKTYQKKNYGKSLQVKHVLHEEKMLQKRMHC